MKTPWSSALVSLLLAAVAPLVLRQHLKQQHRLDRLQLLLPVSVASPPLLSPPSFPTTAPAPARLSAGSSGEAGRDALASWTGMGGESGCERSG